MYNGWQTFKNISHIWTLLTVCFFWCPLFFEEIKKCIFLLIYLLCTKILFSPFKFQKTKGKDISNLKNNFLISFRGFPHFFPIWDFSFSRVTSWKTTLIRIYTLIKKRWVNHQTRMFKVTTRNKSIIGKTMLDWIFFVLIFSRTEFSSDWIFCRLNFR